MGIANKVHILTGYHLPPCKQWCCQRLRPGLELHWIISALAWAFQVCPVECNHGYPSIIERTANPGAWSCRAGIEGNSLKPNSIVVYVKQFRIPCDTDSLYLYVRGRIICFPNAIWKIDSKAGEKDYLFCSDLLLKQQITNHCAPTDSSWVHTISLFFGSNDGEEHVESNLDSVDKDKTVLGGDELEVHGVDNRPDLPGSLTGTEEVVLDLVSNGNHRVTVHQTKVGKENTHKDGAVIFYQDKERGNKKNEIFESSIK